MDLHACVLYFSHMEQAFWKSWIQNLCADIFCLVWILKCCSVLICIFYFPKSVQHLLKSTKLVIPLWHITPEIEFLNVYLCVTNAPDMRRPKPHRASWQISSAMWRTLKTLTQVASTRKEEVAGLRPLFQFFSWNSDETNKDYLAHLWKNSKTFFFMMESKKVNRLLFDMKPQLKYIQTLNLEKKHHLHWVILYCPLGIFAVGSVAVIEASFTKC